MNIYQVTFPLTSPYNSSGKVFAPIFSSKPLNHTQPKITNAIIVIHGLLTNANDVFCDVFSAALNSTSAEAAAENILVISPWFGTEQVSGFSWSEEEGFSSYISAYWKTSDWMSAGDNTPGPTQYISSFDVLDQIVLYLSNTTLFPELDSVVLTGFSAGAQTIQRFSWATDLEEKLNALNSNLKVRYIVSDPGTYLYLTPARPLMETCVVLNNTGVNWNCSDFAVPDARILADCATYDSWKYGIGAFPERNYLYLRELKDRSNERLERTISFRNKDVRYILGEEDNCNCNVEGFVNEKYCFVTS